MDAPQGGAGAWQLAMLGKLGSTSSPTALRLLSGTVPHDHYFLSTVIYVVAPEVNEIGTASPGGGKGWSIVRVATNFTSKMFVRLSDYKSRLVMVE